MAAAHETEGLSIPPPPPPPPRDVEMGYDVKRNTAALAKIDGLCDHVKIDTAAPAKINTVV